MKLKHLFILIVLFCKLNAYAQEIKVIASNKSLSQILIQIRDDYGVEFSFNDTELSKYKTSLKKTFPTIDKALEYLLRDYSFEFEKISGVYIIVPKKAEVKIEKVKPKVYSISGRIMENKTNELLPYTFLQINSFGILSDQNGSFQYRSLDDSIFNIRISQLGYVIKDTVIYSGKNNLQFYLIPSDQLISEITVNENVLESFLNVGNEPASIKLNHKVTKYLPGSSDNSVFNLLRLQPGVLASGEQTNDVIIWGSYAGQSRITFDGFTVFGLKNYNDNISAINPLMVKNIQLKKAGYDASYGDCVGGIVEISGMDGNNQKAHFNLGLNNFTLNSSLEIPILKKSSLQFAYRQTYYNLYKDGFNLFSKLDSAKYSEFSDIFIYPDYSFRDFNIKYSLKTGGNLFYVSVLNSKDKFNYSFNQTRQYRDIVKSVNEENKQTGASIFFQKEMSDKLNSSLTLSYSKLNTNKDDEYEIFSTVTGNLVRHKELTTINEVSESKAVLKTVYHSGKNHSFELDLQALNNHSLFYEDSSETNLVNSKNSHSYYTVGFKDMINFANAKLDIGFRASYLPYLNKTIFEPRLSYSQSITDKFRYNLALGIYHQFLVKSSLVDEYGNYRYFWAIANGQNIPVLKSNHFVGGFSYTDKHLSINIDAFYKSTYGLTRYVRILQPDSQGIFNGDGRSYGFDFYTKYNFRKHTIWLSYTLSKSLEHFSYLRTEDYVYAPQDQRHELKLASIINLSPFFLSANYVYGSGFLEKPLLQKLTSERIPYSRLDVSVSYKFPKNKNLGECGISILNVLNTQNKKFANFEKVPITQISTVNVFFEAVLFTPTIFLKLTL